MERNCINCKWDRLNLEGRMIQCNQGHVRIFKKLIEKCHAWEEKSEEKCWHLYQKRKNECLALSEDGQFSFSL